MMLPLFWMSTVPVLGGAPGTMFWGAKIATPPRLSSISRLPALNVLLGFAAWSEKSAPDPTATPTATRPVASAASVRFGLRAKVAPFPACDFVEWEPAETSTLRHRLPAVMAASPCRERSYTGLSAERNPKSLVWVRDA